MSGVSVQVSALTFVLLTPRMKLHKVKKRTAEPQNIECRMSKDGIASLSHFFTQLQPIKSQRSPDLDMEPFVGWVEANWSHVWFRSSTQPTRLAAIIF